MFADRFAAGIAYGPNGLGVLHLRGDFLNLELTPAQCTAYKTDGYLVIPDAITSDEADKLLNEAHHLMKRVSEGGEGIIRHTVSAKGEDVPSPIGRILATFEPGASGSTLSKLDHSCTNKPGPDDKSTSNPFERRVSRLGCGVHKLRPFHLLTHSAFQPLNSPSPGVRRRAPHTKSAYCKARRHRW